MKKRIITATAFAACLALCAAVWPQNKPAEETPALPIPPAVIAAQPEVPEMPEIEEIIMPEEEKSDVTQPEPVKEAATALGSSPTLANMGRVTVVKGDALAENYGKIYEQLRELLRETSGTRRHPGTSELSADRAGSK